MARLSIPELAASDAANMKDLADLAEEHGSQTPFSDAVLALQQRGFYDDHDAGRLATGMGAAWLDAIRFVPREDR